MQLHFVGLETHRLQVGCQRLFLAHQTRRDGSGSDPALWILRLDPTQVLRGGGCLRQTTKR